MFKRVNLREIPRMSHELSLEDFRRAKESTREKFILMKRRSAVDEISAVFSFCRKLYFVMLPKDEVCTWGIDNFK